MNQSQPQNDTARENGKQEDVRVRTHPGQQENPTEASDSPVAEPGSGGHGGEPGGNIGRA